MKKLIGIALAAAMTALVTEWWNRGWNRGLSYPKPGVRIA